MTTPITISSTRLNQVREPGQRGLILLIIEVCDGIQHVRQRARRFADFHHLHRHVRKNVLFVQGCGQAAALADAARDHAQAVGNRQVVHRLGGNIERVHQRNAAGEQGGERPRDLCGGELARQRAKEWQPKHRRMQPLLLARRRVPQQARRHDRDNCKHDHAAGVDQVVRDPDDDAGGQRELGAVAVLRVERPRTRARP